MSRRLGCRLHRLRTEHGGAALVREARHVQRTGTAIGNRAACGDAGHGQKLGSVAPGYIADIVAVDGDPLTNIEVAITKVRWVTKAGSVVVDKTNPRLAR